MTYISCPNCGHKALNIATRCPQCGHPFDSRLWQSPASVSRHRRIPVGLIIAGALVTVLIVIAVRRDRQVAVETSAARPSAIAVDSAPQPSPAVAAAQPAESMPPIDSVSPVDSTPAVTDAPRAVPAPSPTPARAPSADESLERRYASTWVNVRAGRSGSAPVVRVLNPGDSLVVDSLRQGWYRVVADGQTLGYVDRGLVRTVPDSVSP